MTRLVFRSDYNAGAVAAPVSAADFYERRRVPVLDSFLAYVEVGVGAPIVFLHGNPTSSYLWRNITPPLQGVGRCLAPDLIGMGRSGKAPGGRYRFADHARYLDAWFDALALRDVTLVVHDWGSALGFDWASRHPDAVRGIAYMEAIVAPMSWAEFAANEREPERPVARVFRGFRSPAGEEMVLEKNVFVERVLPGSILRPLTDEEMTAYRRPFAEPGSILVGAQREFCRRWPNQQEVTVRGSHFVQEDSPAESGRAIVAFLRRLPR